MATDPSNVKAGDIVLTLSWAKVERNAGNRLTLRDLDSGMDFQLIGRKLIEECLSADAVVKTTKVRKTKLAEVLISSYNQPFTVCFEKSDGSDRVLRGRLEKPEPLLGRSSVSDLDLPPGGRTRLVDHRTIKWIVVGGTKYTLLK